jgi:hypothetical protein
MQITKTLKQKKIPSLPISIIKFTGCKQEANMDGRHHMVIAATAMAAHLDAHS